MLNGVEPRPPRDKYIPWEEAAVMIGLKKSTIYNRMREGRLLYKSDESGHRYIIGYEINCYWRKAMGKTPIPYKNYGKSN